jgi:hypothetical protein
MPAFHPKLPRGRLGNSGDAATFHKGSDLLRSETVLRPIT